MSIVSGKVLVASPCAYSFVAEHLQSAQGPLSLCGGGRWEAANCQRVTSVTTQVSKGPVGAQGGHSQSLG